MRGRLQRGGRQRTIEVGFMHLDQAQTGRRRVGTKPPERQLIGCGENDKDVRGGVPVGDNSRMGDGEIERGVRRLTCLRPGREIGAGDQVETGGRTLTVWHEIDCTRTRPALRSR